MSMAVGVKVMAEMIAAAGGLIFISGLVLRGRARNFVTRWGAAFIGVAGLVILIEIMLGLLDVNRIPSALLMLLFGTAVTTGVAEKTQRFKSNR